MDNNFENENEKITSNDNYTKEDAPKMEHSENSFENNQEASTNYYNQEDASKNEQSNSFVYNDPFRQDYNPNGKEFRPRRPIAVIILACVICFCITFGGAFGGVMLARSITASQTGENKVDNNNSSQKTEDNNGSVSNDILYTSNPSSVVVKAESEPSVYGSAGTDVFSVSEVVRIVQDAVVVINAQTTSGTSAGSGVIISDKGYILTCNHVIDEAKTIQVTLNNGNSYTAELVGKTSDYDIAIIRIFPEENETLTYAKLGVSGDLVTGEQVVAIGNPLGTLGGTVTTGIISATEREITIEDTTMVLLQTDTAVNSGNSGGGLFNLQGELIGIVNAKMSATGVEGIAFAIPIDTAYPVMTQLMEYGYIKGIVYSGLELMDIGSNSYYRYYGYSTGVYVLSSELNEDLQNGDKLLTVNGTSVSTKAEVNAIIQQLEIGDTITITYSRSTGRITKEYETEITLTEYVPDYVKD